MLRLLFSPVPLIRLAPRRSLTTSAHWRDKAQRKFDQKIQQRRAENPEFGQSYTRWNRYKRNIYRNLPTVPAFLCTLSLVWGYFYMDQVVKHKKQEKEAEEEKLREQYPLASHEPAPAPPRGMEEFHGMELPKLLYQDSPFTKDNTTVVFVLGGPGSGKGTQCKRLAEEFGFVHLSAGDLLREEQQRPDSAYAELIEWCIREGKIVPMVVTITLLREAMKQSGSNLFLIDGFPRSMTQGSEFEQYVCPPRLVYYLECDEETMTARLLDRGRTSGRIDDNMQSIKKRFQTYVVSTYPVLSYYQNMHKRITVDSTRPVDEVYADLQRVTRKILTVHPENPFTKPAPTEAQS
ncbi:bifunctional uridylate/adenylate kinase [Dimargaris xerosporica]|nr:bifunctional uridylate/adenylate kinase [Dimargaris xerosporica]